MVKSPTGYPIQSPYLSIANRQVEIMMKIAAEFGFTPASRSRIVVHGKVPKSVRPNMKADLREVRDAPDRAAADAAMAVFVEKYSAKYPARMPRG